MGREKNFRFPRFRKRAQIRLEGVGLARAPKIKKKKKTLKLRAIRRSIFHLIYARVDVTAMGLQPVKIERKSADNWQKPRIIENRRYNRDFFSVLILNINFFNQVVTFSSTDMLGRASNLRDAFLRPKTGDAKSIYCAPATIPRALLAHVLRA